MWVEAVIVPSDEFIFIYFLFSRHRAVIVYNSELDSVWESEMWRALLPYLFFGSPMILWRF